LLNIKDKITLSSSRKCPWFLLSMNSPWVVSQSLISMWMAALKEMTLARTLWSRRLVKVSKMLPGSQLVIEEKITRISLWAKEGTVVKFESERSKEDWREALPSKSEKLLILLI